MASMRHRHRSQKRCHSRDSRRAFDPKAGTFRVTSVGGPFHVSLGNGTSAQRGLVVPSKAWRRCADDPATLLRLIALRIGQGLLVIEHRAEIADAEPTAAGFQSNLSVNTANGGNEHLLLNLQLHDLLLLRRLGLLVLDCECPLRACVTAGGNAFFTRSGKLDPKTSWRKGAPISNGLRSRSIPVR
jgi:hypothetical protein